MKKKFRRDSTGVAVVHYEAGGIEPVVTFTRSMRSMQRYMRQDRDHFDLSRGFAVVTSCEPMRFVADRIIRASKKLNTKLAIE